jgi:tetratricopeptide (TPR) repeat protein
VTVTASRTIQAAAADFVGREREIADLCETLRRAGRVSVSAVQGMGGVGKSELARRVAEELRGDFPVRLWLELQLSAARKLSHKAGEGYALCNLGNAYRDLGETHRAIEFYEQYLAIAREIGDRRGEGTALYNRALAYDSLGEQARAVADAEAALAIKAAIEDPYAAQVRAALAKWAGEEVGE